MNLNLTGPSLDHNTDREIYRRLFVVLVAVISAFFLGRLSVIMCSENKNEVNIVKQLNNH